MEYVYILSNPKNQGIVKIGKIKNHPDLRAMQLNRATGTFGEYKVIWSKEVEDSTIVEKVLHHIFDEYHVEKEFFKIEENIAIEVAEKIVEELVRIEQINRSKIKAYYLLKKARKTML